MKHTPENLDRYLRDNGPRFATLSSQMWAMHSREFREHVTPAIRDLHVNAAIALDKLAKAIEGARHEN